MRKSIALLPVLMGLATANEDESYRYENLPRTLYDGSKRSGFYRYSGIVGNGKSRKKKTNKLHRSRMLKRKHAKK